MIYDIEKNEYFDPEVVHETPKWNHSAILAPSIPSWKYFIFGGSVGSFEEGGNRTTSRLSESVYVLDIDSLHWEGVALENEKEKNALRPRGRESPAVLFD